MGAACCSHPLDLLKVRLQLQTCASAAAAASSVPAAAGSSAQAAAAGARQGLLPLVAGIVRNEGVLSLYSGLSASLLRQATYSTVRFGTYEGLKQRRLDSLRAEARRAGGKQRPPTDLPMLDSIAFSLFGGAVGGVAGNPADLVNVRMQNDAKLPPAQRRNYAHVGEALLRIARQEGVLSLWNGVGPNVLRAMLMTSGQLASYDLFKRLLVQRAGCDERRIGTHLTASCLAGVVATVLTQPIDVVKTRVMNAAKAQSNGGATSAATAACAPTDTLSVVRTMLRAEGPAAFFKGFVPALTRLGPHTIATFVFLEQLKKLVGC